MIAGAAHLTYCTNIHPGESWPEVRRTLETHVCAVKRAVSPDRPFGVGLRLSAAAAESLEAPVALAELRIFLKARGLYVFTINGFPHGRFHGTAVKEQVYRPDWREDERLRYSDRLARLLAALLPRDDGSLEGSISTVPGAFKPRGAKPGAREAIAGRLLAHAATLWRLREAGGPVLSLALEPEPQCLLETTSDVVDFFKQELFASSPLRRFAAETGLSGPTAEEVLRRHLGVCLDACHAAVEFEDPNEAVDRLLDAGVKIAKVQISAGLRVPRLDAAARAALAHFAEGVYLHQVVVRRAEPGGARLERHLDLPEALASGHGDADEWRVHFHVPLFQTALGPFTNTHEFLEALLRRQRERPFTTHLEVETYTWDVLPPELRGEPVDGAIARELRFTLRALGLEDR